MNSFTKGCAVIYLPDGEGGAKIGLDDFFVADGTVPELHSHATNELRPLPHSEHGEAL